MRVDKTQKLQLVNGMKDSLSKSTIAIVTRQSGLSVDEVSMLRSQVRGR